MCLLAFCRNHNQISSAHMCLSSIYNLVNLTFDLLTSMQMLPSPFLSSWDTMGDLVGITTLYPVAQLKRLHPSGAARPTPDPLLTRNRPPQAVSPGDTAYNRRPPVQHLHRVRVEGDRQAVMGYGTCMVFTRPLVSRVIMPCLQMPPQEMVRWSMQNSQRNHSGEKVRVCFGMNAMAMGFTWDVLHVHVCPMRRETVSCMLCQLPF